MKKILVEQKNILLDIEKLLNKEREILINNDGQKLKEIIDQKEDCLKQLDDLEIEKVGKYGSKKLSEIQCDFNEKKELLLLGQLVKEIHTSIREKQEINFMLTKQSIEYQNMIIQIIRNTVNNSGTIYGKDGRVNGKPHVHTSIDRSV